MLYGLVIAIHVIVCIILIAVILFQAGRGGGLSETFGGGEASQTIFGTKATTFFSRATIAAASIFLITSLLLGIMTSRRGRSLINLERLKEAVKTAQENQQIPEQAQEVNTEELPLAEPQEIPE